MSGRFIAIVGPSGVGKDSVMTAMAKAEPRLTLTRRVITRPSDAGGEEFDGVSLRAFETLEDAGSFALSWAAHGLKYGIPTVVDQSLMDGRDVLANLSRGALLKAKSRFASFTIIHLTARHDVLAQRLSQRGREDTAEISRRLEACEDELKDLGSALEELTEAFEQAAERLGNDQLDGSV